MGKKQRRGKSGGRGIKRKFNEIRRYKVQQREKRIEESTEKNKWRSPLIRDPESTGSEGQP